MPTSQSSKPNILMIMTDQHRFDALSCVKGGIPRTPSIDRIAEQGVRFANAYAASPVCAPSRAALKSGMYPPGCGVVQNWVEFKEDIPLMTHRLKALGYETAMVGKLHFVPAEDDFGFDWKMLADAPYSIYANDDKHSAYIKWLREKYYKDRDVDPVALFDKDELLFHKDDWYEFLMGSNFRTEEEHDIPWTTQESLHYLDERDPEKPFFLFASYFGPHQPFDPPAPWNGLYDPAEVAPPPQYDVDMSDNPIFQARCAERAKINAETWGWETYQKMIAAYYGQVSMLDHYIDRLFQRLRKEGLWDDTLVIFVGDHGDHNGAYGLFTKGQMYDSCCKIPMLVKPPRSDVRGVVRQENVNIIDLYGTVLDFAGDTGWQQPQIEARSLLPLIEGRSEEWDNHTYSIIGQDPNSNLTMLRRGNMKLSRLAQGPEEALYELYDMTDVVVEVRNVYDDPRYREVRDALKAELDAWWREQAAKYPKELKSHRI